MVAVACAARVSRGHTTSDGLESRLCWRILALPPIRDTLLSTDLDEPKGIDDLMRLLSDKQQLAVLRAEGRLDVDLYGVDAARLGTLVAALG